MEAEARTATRTMGMIRGWTMPTPATTISTSTKTDGGLDHHTSGRDPAEGLEKIGLITDKGVTASLQPLFQLRLSSSMASASNALSSIAPHSISLHLYH